MSELPLELIRELDLIAPELQTCRFNAEATLRYDFFADGLYWDDEYPRTSSGCDAAFRYLLHYRTLVIMNRSYSAALQELWEQAKARFPEWPGFKSERMRATPDLQNFFLEKSEQAMKDLEDEDR